MVDGCCAVSCLIRPNRHVTLIDPLQSGLKAVVAKVAGKMADRSARSAGFPRVGDTGCPLRQQMTAEASASLRGA